MHTRTPHAPASRSMKSHSLQTPCCLDWKLGGGVGGVQFQSTGAAEARSTKPCTQLALSISRRPFWLLKEKNMLKRKLIKWSTPWYGIGMSHPPPPHSLAGTAWPLSQPRCLPLAGVKSGGTQELSPWVTTGKKWRNFFFLCDQCLQTKTFLPS